MYLLERLKFIKGKNIAGIHLIISTDNSWNMNIIIIKSHNSQAKITMNLTDLTDKETIISLIPKNIPISLSIEGKGIIHRKVSTVFGSDRINQILPNAKQSEFYIQLREVTSEQSILSLIRIDTLNEVLNFFKKNNYFLCKLYLGPFSLNNLILLELGLIEIQEHSGYKIKYVNRLISEIEYIGKINDLEEMSILGVTIPMNSIIPYANAQSFFIEKNNENMIQLGSLPMLMFEEFIYKRSFRFVSLGLVGSLFIALLFNFLFYTHFSEDISLISKQYSSGLDLINQLEKIKTDISIRENLIIENKILQQTRISYFADRIGTLLPNQVVLTRMEIYPLLSKPKRNQEIALNKNALRINGRCSYSITLNNWIEILKEEKWISHIEVILYKQEEIAQPGEFTLIIDLQ